MEEPASKSGTGNTAPPGSAGGSGSAGSAGAVPSGNHGDPATPSLIVWADLSNRSPSRLPSSAPAAPEMSPGALPIPTLSTMATPPRISTNNAASAASAAAASSAMAEKRGGGVEPTTGVVRNEGEWGQPRSAAEGLPDSLPLTGLTFEGVFSPAQVSCRI